MALSLLSERILIRDFTLADWPAVQAYGSRPEVYRFQAWGPITPEEARGYVELTIVQAQEKPRTNYTLSVVLAATNEVIGSCGLIIRSQKFLQGEIAYFLHPDYWGRGYATEVAQRLLDFGFTTLGLHRITATCDPRNTSSLRVLEKIGMRYEGTLREAVLIRDGWRDSLLYSLLKHEWRQPRP